MKSFIPMKTLVVAFGPLLAGCNDTCIPAVDQIQGFTLGTDNGGDTLKAKNGEYKLLLNAAYTSTGSELRCGSTPSDRIDMKKTALTSSEAVNTEKGTQITSGDNLYTLGGSAVRMPYGILPDATADPIYLDAGYLKFKPGKQKLTLTLVGESNTIYTAVTEVYIKP